MLISRQFWQTKLRRLQNRPQHNARAHDTFGVQRVHTTVKLSSTAGLFALLPFVSESQGQLACQINYLWFLVGKGLPKTGCWGVLVQNSYHIFALIAFGNTPGTHPLNSIGKLRSCSLWSLGSASMARSLKTPSLPLSPRKQSLPQLQVKSTFYNKIFEELVAGRWHVCRKEYFLKFWKIPLNVIAPNTRKYPSILSNTRLATTRISQGCFFGGSWQSKPPPNNTGSFSTNRPIS